MQLAVAFLMILKFSLAQNGCTTPNNRIGECVKFEECPPLIKYYKLIQSGDIPKGGLDLIKKSVCNMPDAAVKVCCRVNNTITLNVEAIKVPDKTQSNNQHLSGAQLLESPQTCGKQRLSDRIVGGHNARLREWPWIVIFRFKDNLGSSTWGCGGTLISRRYVISAAHCFHNTEVLFARIGEHTLQNEPDCDSYGCAPTPQDIGIEKVTLYPRYAARCGECDDIALVRLKTPVAVDGQYVNPICLPINPPLQKGSSALDYKGLEGLAAGWGYTAADIYNRQPSNILQVASLTIGDLDYCKQLKLKLPNPDTAFCAGTGDGKDTCNGDSGGPLTITNQFKTKTFLIGITSRGPEACGSADTQGLYTNVTHYMPWILHNLRP